MRRNNYIDIPKDKDQYYSIKCRGCNNRFVPTMKLRQYCDKCKR